MDLMAEVNKAKKAITEAASGLVLECERAGQLAKEKDEQAGKLELALVVLSARKDALVSELASLEADRLKLSTTVEDLQAFLAKHLR